MKFSEGFEFDQQFNIKVTLGQKLRISIFPSVHTARKIQKISYGYAINPIYKNFSINFFFFSINIFICLPKLPLI